LRQGWLQIEISSQRSEAHRPYKMVTFSVATARSALLRQARRSTSTTVVPAYTNVVSGRVFSSAGSALLFLPQAEQPRRLLARCFSTAQSSSMSDGLEVAVSSSGGATEIVSKADMQQEETKRVRLSEVSIYFHFSAVELGRFSSCALLTILHSECNNRFGCDFDRKGVG
jgi:hypothetical protein